MKVSLRTIADYMTSSAATQRNVLFNAKYESEEEPQAKIHYYKLPLEEIKKYHRGTNTSDDLLKMAERLENEAVLEKSQARATRLKNNARALRDYEANLAHLSLKILSREKLSFPTSASVVTVSANPDFVAEYKGRKRYIRLDFSVDGLDDSIRKILMQGTFEAACNSSPSVVPSDVILFHVRSGAEIKGARMGARLRKDIDATCSNIAAIWPTI